MTSKKLNQEKPGKIEPKKEKDIVLDAALVNSKEYKKKSGECKKDDRGHTSKNGAHNGGRAGRMPGNSEREKKKARKDPCGTWIYKGD
ncbi:MAG: hypothetical protein H8D23_38050 [Candidatus Brocadiales bacterium]|nr:hypothetical protein [Candidatus Brocadiales bacterium]